MRTCTQALVVAQHPNAQSPPLRQASGVARERLGPIIVSVLHKFVCRMSDQNVTVSVTGGLQVVGARCGCCAVLCYCVL